MLVPAGDGGADWVYFCLRAPEVRVRADNLMNLSAYETVNVTKPLAFGSFNRAAARWVPQLNKFVLIAEAKEPHMGRFYASTAPRVQGACRKTHQQWCFRLSLVNARYSLKRFTSLFLSLCTHVRV